MDAAICSEILGVFEHYRAKYGVDCLGYVLMPDHLHALLLQRYSAKSISSLIGSFKSYTSRHCHIPIYPMTKLWRDYFDDVPVPGPDAAITKLRYLHENPLRRGMVADVEEYAWSSARDYADVEVGIVTVTKLYAIAGLETHNGE